MTPTIEKCKPGLATTEAFGMELPIIADLGGGCFLVAHPNGAGIANKACLSGLHQFSTLMPQQIQIKALEEFEKFAWPLVRGQFYDQPIETCEVGVCVALDALLTEVGRLREEATRPKVIRDTQGNSYLDLTAKVE